MLCCRIIGNEFVKGKVYLNGNVVYIGKFNVWYCYLKKIYRIGLILRFRKDFSLLIVLMIWGKCFRYVK